MTPATLNEASKEDLRDELLRIKSREKKLKDETKVKGQQLIGSAITVFTAGGLSYVLGGREKELKKKEDWATLSDEDKQKALQKEQSIMGIDIDLGVGLVGVALGLSEGSGDFSNTLMSIGVGGLTSYAARFAYGKGAAPDVEESA